MDTPRLFAYGTLRDGNIRRALFGGRPHGTTDVLEGYAKTTTLIEGVEYPNIVESEGGSVEGELMVVDEATLQGTDTYETAAYDRRKVKLKSGAEAWVYIRPDTAR